MSTAKRKKRSSSSLKGSLNPSKRHRDRFNIELDNLAKLLPFPHDVIQKLDKLSILRLSASYLRAKNFFKGQQWTEENQVGKLTDGHGEFEGNGVFSKLLLDALDGFVIVLTRDFEVFYASETVQDYLGLAQASVIHQDFLRFIHVDDHDLIRKNLQPFPEEEEQKIRILDDENDGTVSEPGSTCSGEELAKDDDDVETERSFVCRMKCILNTSAGFFKPFRCSGRLREMTLPDSERREYGLFMICTPLETVSSSMLEIRLKTSLFCTKNRMDLSFMDIDQKGRSLLGYHKRDIALQSSYCMIHFDDIPVLQTLHSDLMSTGKCQGTFRMLNKNLKWQWLTGTAQVVFKGNEADFIITTNRPLSDEEGEEILRQRGQFPALPFTASECGSPSPRSPRSPGSVSTYSNGGSPQAIPWESFSATGRSGFKFHPSNGRVNKKKPQHIPDGIANSPGSGSTSPLQGDLPPSPQHPRSPFPDALLSSTSCTSAPLSPPLLDLGVDIQAELEKDVSELDFTLLDPQDLTLDDLPPLDPIQNLDEMASSMSLLAVNPPTYEEAILLAADCLSSSCSESTAGLTSPDGSHFSMSQSPPKGNLEHFSPNPQMPASPYPSPGHPVSHMSSGGLPTPDPSPIGNRNPSTASVNISWQGVGQMKVSNHPQPHCPPQQAPYSLHQYSSMPSPQVPSKSAQITATIKKMEKMDMYSSSCLTGQSPNQMTSPRGMPQNIPGSWQQQHHLQQQQMPQRDLPPQGYGWKASQPVHNAMQNFHGQGTASMSNENPIYATNMQGGNWDNVSVPSFEDTLPALGYEGKIGYMKSGQNFGGHLQHHNVDPSILSPPYQEDFHSGFGFQGNPLPVVTSEQTTLGHW